MYLCPNPPSASVPISFPYNQSPIAHSPCTSSLAVATWFPPRSPSLCPSPASQLPVCHLHHLSSLFPQAIFCSLGKSSTYRSISTQEYLYSLGLCVRMQVGWLLGREGQSNYFAGYALSKPAKGHCIWKYLADLPKCIEICQMFLKSVILIHWCFRALYASRPFTPWQRATGVWCRNNEPMNPNQGQMPRLSDQNLVWIREDKLDLLLILLSLAKVGLYVAIHTKMSTFFYFKKKTINCC